MRERFEQIYATREWGRGSGEGSYRVHTRGYVEQLQTFMRDHNVKSVVDLGCGDWQFSKYIDWDGIHYCGLDVVKSVIDDNSAKHASSNIEFQLVSKGFDELPPADLLIAKDVLQHLSHQTVLSFLPVLHRYKHSLITNCVNPSGKTRNDDINNGEFRYLDIRLPPFDVQAKEIYSFTNHRSLLGLLRKPRWLKRVLLVSQY